MLEKSNILHVKKAFTTGFMNTKWTPLCLECYNVSPVREEAGLGKLPEKFTTNASEYLNAILKKKVNFKKNELPTFVNLL